MTLLTRHRARMQADVRFARRRRARRTAYDRLNKTLNSTDPAARADGFAEVVTGYLSDHFGLPSRNLTPAEVRSLASVNGFDANLAEEIAAFLERCDAVRYAPSDAENGSSGQTGDRVKAWIDRIEGAKA